MKNIETNSGLLSKPIFQQSSKDTYQNEVFESSERLGDVKQQSAKNSGGCVSWVVESVVFPDGTEFRGKYKGYFYYGKVRNGILTLGEKEFISPCEAALTITRTPIDGWLFWDCKMPEQVSWMNISEFKKLNSVHPQL
ncbi:MAG: hypothetical protein JRD87_01795 [Deltaproteobacteria bacterium]|jgi:hypothetical protein|nr:hypothetical protein [Deltaproteobacteria bacterium]MBW2239546.1 hypothetical protein [Deltaproteobacteria bacterium]MBW2570863.1 hypothetical protein [Deltaproteobacteria bacterium]MBW2668617.1 hypothetical protein [Deltaproteobacteria bacterium]MBW2711048.1 hypothetical protein [Deltaproteobacteria bacterium]